MGSSPTVRTSTQQASTSTVQMARRRGRVNVIKRLRMPKDNLSVSLPKKMRSLVEREAKRRKRSRSAVVREALQVYFRLRQIGVEDTSAQERRAVAKGRNAYTQGDLVSLGACQRALGFGDHQAG